jgi:hypothetical protein
MFIPDLDPEFFSYGFFPDPGIKKDKKLRIRIRNTVL